MQEHIRPVAMISRSTWWAVPIATLLAMPARSQSFSTCSTGDQRELDRSIAAHEEHTFRLQQKFLDVFYYRGPIPHDFVPATRTDVERFLRELEPRRAAVLFFAYRDRKLCAWLISPTGLTSSVGVLAPGRFERLGRDLGLGPPSPASARAWRRRGIRTAPAAMPSSVAAAMQRLARASEDLLPPRIAHALVRDSIATLIVVPIAELGHVPFPALRVADSLLVDRLAVMIAPGFYAFKDAPRRTPRELSPSLIVGDPAGWRDPEWVFPPLPHARDEARTVASVIGGGALVGTAATRSAAEQALRDSSVRLVYLATHGVSSSGDPRDASFLVMSDGRWRAADIQKLALAASRPLVVLSACQTGLGKDFEVGTIGMARAWYRAGASSVVMSLWNVDDESTAQLMTDFVRRVRDHPVDEALRLAMRDNRRSAPHPAHWAGFSVFGLPGR